MKIAIHKRIGSFSDRWIEYCVKKNIPHKIVNCYDSNIIKQIEDCDALMWHHHQSDYKDMLFAKQLLFSVEQAGKKTFPDINTGWHFDDKIGQKYLLESIGAPLVPSYVFYTKKKALEWVNASTFPKVFKLRGGSGSMNVKLISNKKQAKKLINKAFGKGFSQLDKIDNLKERIRRVKEGIDSHVGILKGVGRLFIPTEFHKMHPPEKGYVYFQDFVPNNKYDTRIIIVGKRAFAINRGVRKGDFRASGSGDIRYKVSEVDIKAVKISFEINKQIKAQSIAFDYVSCKGMPMVVEISYGYAIQAYDPCPGYWDVDLNWHEGQFNPQAWMVDDLIKTL